MSQDAGNAKGKRRKATKTPKNRGAERLKCSLLLTPENDLRLTVLAVPAWDRPLDAAEFNLG